MRRFLVLISTLICVFVSPAFAQDNLLQNPSFDSEVYIPISFDPLDTNVYMAVPLGWGGGVIQSPRTESWMNVHPTGLPHIGGIKVNGWRSYHIARGGGTFTAFIYQQVTVQPGTTVQGGAWVFIEGNTGIARVGIDPNGGTNPYASGIVWAETAARGQWSTPSVSATANNSTITLFLFATQSQPSNPNGVYWDAAYLYGTAGTSAPQAQPAAPEGTTTLRTTVGRLNVRTGPGTNFNVIGVISPENVYAVQGESNGWYQIDYGGQTGWVSGRFVRVSGGGTAPIVDTPIDTAVTYTTNAPLRIRSAPTTDAQIIGTIPWGLTAEVIGRTSDNRWVQVRYGNTIGWSAVGFGRIRGGLSQVAVTG
ncbi:MAG: hypothetical protein Kow00117_17200 [Phototrophicales bacterium]